MKKKLIITLVVFILVIAIVIVGAIFYYNESLKPVNNNSEKVTVEIEKGMVASQIADRLESKGLIKNALTFKIYSKFNKVTGLQAGTYKLDKNMSVEEIVKALKKGSDYFPDTIDITFLEGKNMRWIAKTIAEKTNNTEDDVFAKLEDKQYIQSLIQKYWFLTDEIENENIYYPLEGYLFPDTYNFTNKDVTIEQIFTAMLDQMEDKLEKYKTKMQNAGASVHKLLTVASITELEAAKPEDRAGVAGVIYNRLNNNMAIGSDVTTYYAIKVDMSERDLYQSELNKYNPYNTRGPKMEGKLPIGPISTVGIESIDAAFAPEQNDYLYFVADKNGKVYFAKDIQGHENNIAKLKQQGLWFNY